MASLVLPAACRICSSMLDTGNRIPFCRACITKLTEALPEPHCARCGRPIVSSAVTGGVSAPQCHLCRLGAYDFDFVRSFGAYSASMARAVLMLKYGEITPLGGWFATHLAEMAKLSVEAFAADLVVPVPLHPSRLLERGDNQ